MTHEAICALRDQIIMDPNYSDEQKVTLIDALSPQIYVSC